MSTSARPPRDEPPQLRDIAPHIERRMHGQTGRVTLHFVQGKFQRAEYTTFEDARAMPKEARAE